MCITGFVFEIWPNLNQIIINGTNQQLYQLKKYRADGQANGIKVKSLTPRGVGVKLPTSPHFAATYHQPELLELKPGPGSHLTGSICQRPSTQTAGSAREPKDLKMDERSLHRRLCFSLGCKYPRTDGGEQVHQMVTYPILSVRRHPLTQPGTLQVWRWCRPGRVRRSRQSQTNSIASR